MSTTLTDELLREIIPPAGDVGDRQYGEFETAVAEAMGAVNASAARLVALIRRCLLEGWWQAAGTHSPEHWVMACCAVDRQRAHRLVRIARELGDYPTVAAVFATGQLTEDHVLTIVTKVDPAREADIADAAGSWNIAQLRRLSAAFPKPIPEPDPPDDEDEPEPEPPRESRPADVLSFGWNDEGRFSGRFDVGAELGAILEKALTASRSRLFVERSGNELDLDDDDALARLSSITWSAALERMLHAALQALDPSTAAGHRPSDRYLAMVHVDAEHPERSRIHLGPLLTKTARRYLTCDASVRAALWRDGRPVSVGRKHHTVDPIMRAFIEDRDRACRNCGATGFVHVHHLVHWEDGGCTDDDNLCCLCPTCHKQVHRGDLRIIGDPTKPDGLVFLDRRGRPLPRPGPLPPAEPPPRACPYAGPDRSPRLPGGYYVSP